MRGIEIGPFHSPLCPKKEGYNCLVLDVFSRDQLLEKYMHDEYLQERIDDIEDVDIVSDKPLAQAIADWSAGGDSSAEYKDIAFDYIISSHNFERLPNPIRFLQDAEHLLNEGGLLLMAIPIASRCLDCFKPLSTSGSIIDAFLKNNIKPTFGTVFDNRISRSVLNNSNDYSINSASYDFEKVSLKASHPFPSSGIDKHGFKELLDSFNSNHIDSHCWCFNTYSFELIFKELRSCGFFPDLCIDSIETFGSEFIVHIKKSSANSESLGLPDSERTTLVKKSITMLYEDLMVGNNLSQEVKMLKKKLVLSLEQQHQEAKIFHSNKILFKKVISLLVQLVAKKN